MWRRPANRNISTSSLSEHFNDKVEVDLLFWKRHIVLHMCDVLTRWGEAGKIESRETTCVLRGLRQHWTARWAPPNCFISDGEGALDSHEARVWAEKIGTQLVIRPTGGIGAATVERHNEILRQSLHRIEEQFTTEGIAFVPEDVIAEALMAKNCLL